MRTRTFEWTALTILIIGAINWGLFGFFQLDLVASIFGGDATMVSRIIYVIIGVAGLYGLSMYSRIQDGYGRTTD